LPHSSEQTSESHTLPSAELNPLINPLLAENMGRWAEVYFTTPPESREQAVLELLHELEAQKSRREADLASELAAQPALVRCEHCGHDNPAVNKFCGMCGGPTNVDDVRRGESEDYFTENGNGQSRGHEAESEQWSDTHVSNEYAPPRHELSLFQAYRETDADDAGDWAYEQAPSSSSRWYIGVVLAMMLLGLGYMAWRAMQNSQSSHEVSAPPPAAAQQNPADTQASSSAKPEVADTASSGNTGPARPPNDGVEGSASESSKPSAPEPVNKASAPESKPRTAPVEPPGAIAKKSAATDKAAAPAASDRWGAEELVVAQRYLNGASGQHRDTSEAAKWLWKSIAKHNGQATLLLADLYLKGDGVSKNCDQARVLLDSAARKGISGAGERLRNLQAFGCQ
jgi:hypothetical protein